MSVLLPRVFTLQDPTGRRTDTPATLGPWPRRVPRPCVVAACRRWRVVECAEPAFDHFTKPASATPAL